MTDFATLSRPTARKEHRCYSCSRRIQAGEIYARLTGRWDGHFYSSAVCVQCDTFMSELHDHGIEDWDTGGFAWPAEIDWQNIADLGSVRLMRALVLFRRRWTHRDGSVYPYPAEVPA